MGKKTNSLLARLNTYKSLSEGQGIYVDFGEESESYKDRTFKEVINAMVEEALASEVQEYKEIADYVKMVTTKNIPQANLEIRAYGHGFNGKSVSSGLDDKIKDYITEKEVNFDGKPRKVDYLDIIVTLILWD